MTETILVIDDEADTLKMITLMLRREGYDILTANTGQAGLDKAISSEPDLILLDIMMPDMDGLEVCRRLRAESVTSETPVIMFTAKNFVEDKVAGFEAGVTDYLTKPTHPAELAARVKAALRMAPRPPQAQAGTPSGDQGRSIGFLGVKGGIGTSSLSASVGAILAKDQSTALVELRPGQGTLAISLGLKSNSGLHNVLNLPSADITPESVSKQLVDHSSKVRLLLSSMNQQEATASYAPASIVAMKEAMSQQVHYSLFDLGAGLSRVSVPLLRQLNQIVVLTAPNQVSLAIASSIMSVLKTRIQEEQIVVVVANHRESDYQKSGQEIEAQLGRPVVATIPFVPDVAYQAVESGIALVQFQPDSAAAQEISRFATELVKPS